MQRFLQQIGILVVFLGALVGCSGIQASGQRLQLERDVLPEETDALISVAEGYWSQARDIKATAKGAAALEKALVNGSNFEVQWRLSRGYATIGEQIKKRGLKRKFLKRAVQFAEQALEAEPERPEGYACLAVARGLFATTMIAPGKAYQETIEEPAEHLADHFPDYESGLGFRILGGLYTKAPPWPAGVGDLEGAIELLEEANTDYPNVSLNAFFLAEAYLKDGQRKAAEGLLRAVLAAPKQGEWALIGARYRMLARQHLADLSTRGGANDH